MMSCTFKGKCFLCWIKTIDIYKHKYTHTHRHIHTTMMSYIFLCLLISWSFYFLCCNFAEYRKQRNEWKVCKSFSFCIVIISMLSSHDKSTWNIRMKAKVQYHHMHHTAQTVHCYYVDDDIICFLLLFIHLWIFFCYSVFNTIELCLFFWADKAQQQNLEYLLFQKGWWKRKKESGCELCFYAFN